MDDSNPERSTRKPVDPPATMFTRDLSALAVALCLHALVWAIAGAWPKHERKKERSVTTRTISKSQFGQNRQVRLKQPLTPEQLARRDQLEEKAKQKKEEREKEKVEKQLKELKGQIVDLPASPTNEAPVEAKYLSEFNTKTERESKSRHRSSDYKRAANEVSGQKSEAPQPAQAAPELAGAASDGTGKPKPAKAGKEAVMEVPRVQKRDRLALQIDNSLGLFKNQAPSESTEGNSARLRMQPGAEELQESGQPGSPSTPPSLQQLMPNLGQLAHIAGAPANDFLSEDVADGDGTFLNSREFKFAPFFNRLKQTVSQHWRPLDEFKRRDPTGNIYGMQNRYTLVNVTIDASGELRNVAVVRSSGVDFLDKEAILAFQRAQPFPNPPKQLMKDGSVEFAFGFHIDFGRMGMQF